MTALPSRMNAWVFSSRGKPLDVLRPGSFPAPKPPKGSDVVVRVDYCALNSVGTLFMGLFPSFFGSTWTAMELDFAGTVFAAGPSAPASLSAVGTPVWGVKDLGPVLSDHSGTLAEYVTVNSALIAPLPENMSAREACGLGVVGCTALEMLQRADVRAGSRILVNGASGGVGTFVVQFGKAMDIQVTGTCSGKNVSMVKELGADEVVDYTALGSSLPQYFKDTYSDRPFDAILDCVGSNELYNASPAYLKPKGKVICVGAMSGVWDNIKNTLINNLLPVFLGGTPRKWVYFNMKPTAQKIQQLQEYAGQGKLRCQVDSEHAMEDALKAYERLGSQRARGKVVIKVS